MSSGFAITVTNLNFRYSGQNVDCLSTINLTVNKGDRFGLFGPNGAGKTTLISIMTGLLKPSNGNAKLFGIDVSIDREAKKIFGYVPQDFAFYDELTQIGRASCRERV